MNNEKIKDKATVEWLQSQKPSTRSGYKTYWKYFVEYVKMSGDQILADRKNDQEHQWEVRVLAFKQWMIDEKKQSQYTATTALMAVRGFFAFHYTPIQLRSAQKKKASERNRKTEDYRFSREDLKKMSDVADLDEKYIVLLGKSFGFRAGDFMRLTRGDLEPYIDRPVPISIGEYATQKESVKAYPFIDSDAQPIVKLMLEKMTREGRTDPNERMLTFKDEIQVTRVLKRVAEKAGITTGNKNVKFHCLRKYLIDRLASVMSESKWKQIVGKKISEGAYVSPDSLREDYTRAMSETCFTKAVAEGDMETIAKKQALLMIAKSFGMDEEQVKKAFRQKARHLGRELNVEEEIEALEELTKKPKTETNGGSHVCSDGEHCQKVVSEQELEPLLAQGWRVVATLPSGRIVLER